MLVPWCLSCWGEGGGVSQSRSFPSSRTKALAIELINTQLPYKGLVLDSLAQPHICLRLRPKVPHASPHTWEELHPACLKKYPPEGCPSRRREKKQHFDMKAETAGLNSSFRSWFMSACNQTTSGLCYWLMGALLGRCLSLGEPRWKLGECSTRLRI